ncbi:hypothetical protein [Loigolactobacillus rennini]|nr:hypothetical protein [Loigolactobacillus rennini]
MKKLTDERLKAARFRYNSYLFYIQTTILILIVIFDYITHGTNYVMQHPALGVLFFTLFLSGIRSMIIAKDYTKHGLLSASIGIISVDMFGLIFILLNIHKPGVALFAILLAAGSLIAFVCAFVIFRK